MAKIMQMPPPLTFNVNSTTDSSAMYVDGDGLTVINKLVLIDEVTGNKWQIKIVNGELFTEPLELEDKRDFKIKKILENEK